MIALRTPSILRAGFQRFTSALSDLRLDVLVVIWFIAGFAPLACIFHCHIWPVIARPAFSLSLSDSADFMCAFPGSHLTTSGVPTQPAHAPAGALPRVIHDVLPDSFLLILPWLPAIAQLRPATFRFSTYRIPPPTPPPRACYSDEQKA